MNTNKNVIILTGGLAGSSVLTSLLGRAGYWTGDDTIKKVDYDTYENSELVSLNQQILSDVGFDEPWTMTFKPEFIDVISSGLAGVDTGPAAAFVAKCGDRSPWVWKDPRLWLTIRFWQQFIDFSSTVFLLIHRDLMQSWISTTKRKQIQTPDYLRRYSDGIHQTLLDFVVRNDADYLDLLYEDLIVEPEATIEQINAVVGTSLTVRDFKAVFRGSMYRKQHGFGSLLHAGAIYLKNYEKRYR